MSIKKLGILILTVLTIFIASAFCINRVQNEVVGSKKQVEDIEQPLELIIKEDNLAMQITTKQDKPITEINPDQAEEISLSSLSLTKDTFEYIVEISDGYLVGDTIQYVNSFLRDSQDYSLPVLSKLDKQGNEVWTMKFNYLLYLGSINQIIQLNNGEIILSLFSHPQYRGERLELGMNYIIKLNSQGEELWSHSFATDSQPKHKLLVTEKNEVIVVDEVGIDAPHKSGKDDHIDILITKISDNGKRVTKKYFGGSRYESVREAIYNKEIGLVVMGTSNSNDGDFVNQSRNMESFLACFDNELNINWVRLNMDEAIRYQNLVLSNSAIYITASKNSELGVLEKISKSGRTIFTDEELYQNMHCYSDTILANGDIVLVCIDGEKGDLVILNIAGQQKKRIPLEYSPREIYPTADGGYVVKAVRNLKNIPQPVYISCIWYDSEVVVEKYSKYHKLEWRKTYDSYKDSFGIDFAQPLPSGKLIIE